MTTSSSKPSVGFISWHDLTVPNAGVVRDFYKAVAGWSSSGQDMGGYEDYNMLAPSGECVAGVCHARGTNADLPAQWLMYITVDDVHASIEECRKLGGEIVAGPKKMGKASYCVIRDPAGAVCALYSEASE
jgi:hypothetical protein